MTLPRIVKIWKIVEVGKLSADLYLSQHVIPPLKNAVFE